MSFRSSWFARVAVGSGCERTTPSDSVGDECVDGTPVVVRFDADTGTEVSYVGSDVIELRFGVAGMDQIRPEDSDAGTYVAPTVTRFSQDGEERLTLDAELLESIAGGSVLTVGPDALVDAADQGWVHLRLEGGR